MYKKLLSFLIIFTFGFVVMITAQERKISKSHAAMKDLKCSSCHDCINPSQEKPCLKLGVTHFNANHIKLTPENIPPDSVIIYKIEEQYGPVKFTHKKHLHMSETLGDCAECHHHSPLDKPFPPCKECHNHDIVLTDLAQVELKGAYHRKCLGCHVEWSKKTDCKMCHTLNGDNGADKSISRPALRYPKEPEELFYFCRFFNGPYVKFSHKKHSADQQMICADCHAKRNCVACHYQNIDHPTLVNALARKGVHGTCSLCHDVSDKNGCKKCHSMEKNGKSKTGD